MHATPKKQFELELGFSSSTKLLLVPKVTWKHMQPKKNPKFKFRFEMGLKLELKFFKLHRVILGIESSSKMLACKNKERKLKFMFGSKMGPKLEFGFSHVPLNYNWHRKQLENAYNKPKKHELELGFLKLHQIIFSAKSSSKVLATKKRTKRGTQA